MKIRGIHAYVATVCAIAALVTALTDWSILTELSRRHLLGLAALTVLGLLSESLPLSYRVGRSAGTTTITFLPLLACVLLFGTEPAILFFLFTGAVGEFLIRRRPLIKASFNVAQYVIATTVAGIAFGSVGGFALAPALETGATTDFVPQFGPFILFGVVFVAVNQSLVSVAIALSQGLRFTDVWHVLSGRSGANIIYDLLVSPIAIAIAFLYFELYITGLLIILLPLLFIRHSYLTNIQLQQANRDLLTALVKAIETRDPYTSGHSLRVSSLAKSIAQEMAFPSRRIEAIETAALLHDIGKIDVVFSDILRKPGSLTPQERAIIESHVTKGEELLRSLSSFKSDVTGAVRHHHERVDGRGYPDGLKGVGIPLGARIIKVCDAIDAMLSDRPYRQALDLSEVRRQLELYSGIQFDERIVNVVLSSDLLSVFADQIGDDVSRDSEPSIVASQRRIETRVG